MKSSARAKLNSTLISNFPPANIFSYIRVSSYFPHSILPCERDLWQNFSSSERFSIFFLHFRNVQKAANTQWKTFTSIDLISIHKITSITYSSNETCSKTLSADRSERRKSSCRFRKTCKKCSLRYVKWYHLHKQSWHIFFYLSSALVVFTSEHCPSPAQQPGEHELDSHDSRLKAYHHRWNEFTRRIQIAPSTEPNLAQLYTEQIKHFQIFHGLVFCFCFIPRNFSTIWTTEWDRNRTQSRRR